MRIRIQVRALPRAPHVHAFAKILTGPSRALTFHNAQLEATAFREEYDPESFEDLTLPKSKFIHKVRRARIAAS